MRRTELSRPAARDRRRRSAAVLLAGAVLLAACGDDDSSSADDTAVETSGATTPGGTEPAGSTAPGGSGPVDVGAEVIVGAVLEPTSLDIVHTAGAALDQILLDNIYETLLTADASGAIQPGLAALPEVSDDGTVYTFAIQEGVTFHDGQPLTSADVVASLEALAADDATGAEDLATIATITAPDDSMVELTLEQPDNDLLFNLTRRAGAVLPAGATGLESSAIGTGPFVFEQWNTGASITLGVNADYWGDVPSIAGVTFLYFTDPNAAVNAFTTGDVDILTGVNSDLVGPLQENPDYVVNEGTTNGEFTLGFNNSREPLADRNVRLAIRQAIDKEGVKALYNEFGTIIGGPVPPTDPWFEDLTDVAPYDPDASRQLLADAGYGDGLDLVLIYPNIYPTNVAEYVASQLADVGIDVEIQNVEFSVWLEQVYTNADYDLTAVLHVEPRDIANYANPEYYWRYDSGEVQQLIGDAKVAPTQDEATDLLRQAAREISEDSPVDWLLLYADLTVAHQGVTGYPVNDTASRFDASGITVAA
ncbi:MAG: ABC transporter substrate-binding protein [Ilumatobacteraceae bacterium]